MAPLTAWQAERRDVRDAQAGRLARRNLALSVPALVLAFAVWSLFGILAAYLPRAGFAFGTTQLFTLAALPALSGAVLRLFFDRAVPILGGAHWTAISTAALLLPVIGVALAVQDPGTSFGAFAALALLCGLGGGNFASSMAHVRACFPEDRERLALGLNAGMGNLGVSLAQFAVPIAVAGGATQDAGLLWVPLIVAAAAAAWFGMEPVAARRAQPERATAADCMLYLGTFGSYIGFAAGVPLLLYTLVPGATTALAFAWIGPFAGALARPLGGWMGAQWGAERVAAASFAAQALACIVTLAVLRGEATSAAGFLAATFAIFVAAGLGKGAVARRIPTVGVPAAFGAAGGFVIPMAFAASMAATGGAWAAFALFIAFYAACAFAAARLATPPSTRS